MERLVNGLNEFLYGSYYKGYRSGCNAASATFEVVWFHSGEYAHAQVRFFLRRFARRNRR